VLLVAIGLESPLRGIVEWAADRNIWIVARSGAAPTSGRLGVLLAAIWLGAPWRWALQNGPALLALIGGAYLLLRRADRLIGIARRTA
jgi:hypothetical protein